MGRCHDFGVQVGRDCEHPMQAGDNACSCPHCDSVCEGQFKGCADVWARGPRAVQVASPTLAEHVVGNGQLDHSRNVPSEPAGGRTETRDASDVSVNVLGWPETPIHAPRAQLEALSTAMAHQQTVVTQLVNGYSELRRTSENESLLLAVRTVVEGALQRLEGGLREDMARDSRRLNEVAGALQELEVRQRAHQESVATGRDELRSELHDALREERRQLSEEFAATAGAVNDGVGKLREFVTELSAATTREVQDAKTYTSSLLSELKESIAELQASIAAERQGDRQVIAQWLYAMADSVGKVVAEAVTEAIGESEERVFQRLETAVRQVQHSLKDAEEVSARHRMEADRVAGERLREWHASMAELSDALGATHALAAAQREETELLDGAMSTLQESLVELRASAARQHVEIREDLARQRRSSSELIKRQLRPITESLPELVTAAARASEEETLKRVEKAVAKLRRSLQQAEAPPARAHEQAPGA